MSSPGWGGWGQAYQGVQGHGLDDRAGGAEIATEDTAGLGPVDRVEAKEREELGHVPLDFGLVGGLGDLEDPGPMASEEVGPVVGEFLQGIRRSHPDERIPDTEASNEGRKESR